MKIAVYGIVKDEAKHAAQWADATKDADYRMVLDTGSTDDTVEAFRSHGIIVHQALFCPPDADGNMEGWVAGGSEVTVFAHAFRFDVARNAALNLLPDDVDLCVSLDADEVTGPGFFDAIRHAATPGVHKLRPWHWTGTWWRADRVHARYGYRWIGACHEITEWQLPEPECSRDVEATLEHRPDNDKPRDGYLPLLELDVAERPENTRSRWYLTRQYHYAAKWGDVIASAEVLLTMPGRWYAEAAAACRLAAAATRELGGDELGWLQRGTTEAPWESEAWAALVQYHYDHEQWADCYAAATTGANTSASTHYLVDHFSHDVTMPDQAAIAAYQLEVYDQAVVWGYKAWAANPADGRLLENLRWYLKGQAVPVFAVIPKVKGERDGMTAVLVEQLKAQGVTCLVDESDDPIYEKWRNGLEAAHDATENYDELLTAPQRNVLVLNNDLTIGPEFVPVMCAALRSAPDVMVTHPDDGTGAFTGWAFAVRGESHPPIDTRYEWYFGDTDLAKQAAAWGTVLPCRAPCKHLHPNESTVSSPERVAAARRDQDRYAEKWPDVDPATLLFNRFPNWPQVDTVTPVR